MTSIYDDIKNSPRLSGMLYGIVMQSAMHDRAVSFRPLVDALCPPPVRVVATEHEAHRAIFRHIIKPGTKYYRPVPQPRNSAQVGIILWKYVQSIVRRREAAMKAAEHRSTAQDTSFRSVSAERSLEQSRETGET